MKRLNFRLKTIGSLFAICSILVFSLGATKTITTKVTKQFGGSTGDSVSVLPDTSLGIAIPNGTTGWHVTVYADTATIYTTQVSPDQLHWFSIDVDTVGDNSAESTADFGIVYNGWYFRVIQDDTTATGAPFGNAWLMLQK